MTATRVMVYTAAALFVVALAWLFFQIRGIVIIVILGVILASAIDPLVRRLRRVGLSRGQAVLAVYCALAMVVGLTGYLVIPPLIMQAIELVNETPEILANLRDQFATSNNEFVRTTGVRFIDRAELAHEEYRASPPIERDTALGFASSIIGFVFTTFSVLIVGFYWTTEKATIKRLLLGLFQAGKRDYAHDVWDEIEVKLGDWTRGQAVLCGTIGVLSGVAYYAIGIDFWLPLAIFAGITELIPFIGPVIGGSAAAIIALTDSWQKAAIVVVIVFLLQQLEGAVLVPRVMKNAVGLSPLSVILAVFIGGAVLGVIGAIIAIPVAAAVQVLVQNLLRAKADHPEEEDAEVLLGDALVGHPSRPGSQEMAMNREWLRRRRKTS